MSLRTRTVLIMLVLCVVVPRGAAEDWPRIRLLAPDAIRSIDAPTFVAAKPDLLPAREAVLVYQRGETVRMYPMRILMRTEIINDRVDGVPIAATWCPLCDSAVVFDRRLGDRVVELGVSGTLRASNLVMFDRHTGDLWQQASARPVEQAEGAPSLTVLPSQVMGYGDARRLHPQARVVDPRHFGARNPYQGHDDPDGRPWPRLVPQLPEMPVPAMTRIVAIPDGDGWVAWREPAAQTVRIVHVHAGGRAVALHRPGPASPIDRGGIADGRQIGNTVVFADQLDDRELGLEAHAGHEAAVLRDVATGSLWNAAGEAIAGPLQGQRLTRLPHRRFLAFSWFAFHPDTRWLEEP